MDVRNRLPRILTAAAPLRRGLLVLAALGLAAGFYWVGPIPQPPAYHDFADQRTLLGISHIWNVASNLPILLAGLAGLGAVSSGNRGGGRLARPGEALLWGLFFAGAGLTALGSIYYHLAPDSPRLFWDRLPLGLVAACLPAVLLVERVALGGRGRLALAAWVALGPLSVVVWQVSEKMGAGDLRLYGIVQFGALAGVAVILAATRPPYTGSLYYWAALACYGLAKLAEVSDAALFAMGGLLSGHTLKHLAAALAIALLGHMVNWRKPLA
jgi:hypothetical protein